MKENELKKFAFYGLAAYGAYCLYQMYYGQTYAGIHMGAIGMKNPAHMGGIAMGGIAMNNPAHHIGAVRMGMLR